MFVWGFRFVYNKVAKQKEQRTEYKLTNNEKLILQDGDIILRYGYGLASDYIINFFNEEYTISHCGIIKKDSNTFKVIHSESSSMLSEEGILIQDFDEFVNAGHPNSVIVTRYNRLDSLAGNRITQRANYYLKKKIPFDYSFNAKDTTEMFCSEIIWHIFLDEFQHDIFLNKDNETEFNQFRFFWDSSQFDIILNHQKK